MQKIYSQFVCSATTVNRTGNNTYSGCQMLIGLLVLICLLSVPMFNGLWQLWNSDKNFNGLMLVPCLCCLILFGSRGVLASVRPQSYRLFWFILALSVTLMLLSSSEGYVRLASVLFVASLVVFSFAALDTNAVKTLVGPLSFLLLMIPPLHRLIGIITTCLQELFSFVAELFMPVLSRNFLVREGIAFWFAGMDCSMIVAPECSGIRSLLDFKVIASFFAVFDRHKLQTTFVLLTGGVIVALTLNLARILVTMPLKLHGLEDYSMGGWHGFLGIAVFLISCATLSKLSRFLKPVGSAYKKEGK